MDIEKLYLVCPKCFSINTNVSSTIAEKKRCTECGVISHSSDYSVSTISEGFMIEEDSVKAEYKNNNKGWSLVIDSGHWEDIYACLFFGIVPTAFGFYLFKENSFSFLTPLFAGLLLVLGFYSIWELIVRLAGKAKFELSGDQLKYKKGIGLVGFSGSLEWSQVQHINLDVTEKKLHIYTSEFDSKDGYEEIYLDLSMRQLNYIEKFLSDKLSQRDNKASDNKKISIYGN